MSGLGFVVVHGLGLYASLRVGAWAVGEVLGQLRLDNHDDIDVVEPTARPGAAGAGRMIGYAERVIIYLAVVAQLPALIAVLFGLKTWVRYPQVQRSAREADADGLNTGRFAEYYLVGTLTSMAVGLAFPLAAVGLLRWIAG